MVPGFQRILFLIATLAIFASASSELFANNLIENPGTGSRSAEVRHLDFDSSKTVFDVRRVDTGVDMKPVPQNLCPQVRGTGPAPSAYQDLRNPLEPTQENIKAGELLFQEKAKPITCETCHNFSGNGMGVIFQQLKPYPRDFTCYQTMKDVTDGQLLWIIKKGSHGTRMKPFDRLSHEQIWQLILYIRTFEKK